MVWHALCKKHFNEIHNKKSDIWCKETDIGTCDYFGCNEEATYELYVNMKKKCAWQNKGSFVLIEDKGDKNE